MEGGGGWSEAPQNRDEELFVSFASMTRIGVLALQGDYREHIQRLRELAVDDLEVVEVRRPADLEGVHGIVLPGGESTTLGMLLRSSGLLEPLRAWTKQNRPTWGTCAGMILIANELEGAVEGQRADMLGGLRVVVRRNYFGSQLGSFISPLVGEDKDFQAVFIRAPCVVQRDESTVRVLGEVEYVPTSVEAFDKEPRRVCVAVSQGFLLGTSFHPELGRDGRWHARFLDMVRQWQADYQRA